MVKIKIIFFSIFIVSLCFSQVAPNKYRLYFTDKNNSPYSISNPEAFLSSKAISKRIKYNIPIIENDLPVNPQYVDSLRALGLEILNTSKWFNTVTIKTSNTTLLDTITNISFISGKYKTQSNNTDKEQNKFSEVFNENQIIKSKSILNYGLATNQIEMLNGHVLHNLGFKGNNMDIAIIDAGFINVDIIQAFDSARSNNLIIGTRDFVDGDKNVYAHHDHGTNVFSIIGANLPNSYIGTAPNANFWLIRSEDTSSEYIIEEDNWASAAEFADSIGIDIINTSLGYNLFNDPNHNHNYYDLDGNTTIITRAADIAASKGLLVVVSAGNEGSSSWKHITAPADADSVLTVGAIDANGFYASLSSVGPTADGRIKPNIVAQGQGTAVITSSEQIVYGNGTSFSAPIITGLAACLWQANQSYNNMEIINAIIKSADRYTFPDSLYGYGMPNFAKANLLLNNITYSNFNYDNLVNVYPNPFNNQLFIDFYSADSQKVKIEIYDLLGKIVYSNSCNLKITTYNKLSINLDPSYKSGLYILKLITDNNYFQTKIFKN